MEERPTWRDYLKTLPQFLLPLCWLSHGLHYIAQYRGGWLKNSLIKLFIRAYSIDMSIAENSEPTSYQHFNAFFTRRLQAQARPIISDPALIACPVDGFVSQIGQLEQNRLLQVKHQSYPLQRLLPQSRYVEHFNNGAFATLYLSPGDYHRVHCPWDAQLQEVSYERGRLFAVNPSSVRTVSNLFCRNERVCCVFSTSIGWMAVILVGAFLVGSIETVWHGAYTPPHGRQSTRWDFTDNTIKLKKGDELGHFKMGSTAIVLFEAQKTQWQSKLIPGSKINMGETLAKIIT